MAMRAGFDPNTVERKIHFYRIDAGNDDSGQPILYDPTPALVLLALLDYQQLDESGPYLATTDGNLLCCWVDSINAPQRIRYVRVRRTGLPSLLQRGALGPLGIPPDSGLAEEIHLSFFSDNIVGSDFNFFGPRATTLGYYFRQKVGGGGPTVRLEPLLDLDTTRKLERLQDISVLRLRVRPSFVTVLEALDQDLSSALAALQRAGESEEIELVLRPRPYSRSKLKQTLLGVVRGLANVASLREEVSQFEVKGFDQDLGRNLELDILSDRFVSSKRMMKQEPRSRAVTPESAYGAIAEAFDELRNDLIRAAAVRT